MPYRAPLIILGLLACSVGLVKAQDIDANLTGQRRTPSTIADQIMDLAERDAFLDLFKQSTPELMLRHANFFLDAFPQSAFLAQGYEVAARACFDLQDYQSGLSYAGKSLALLPENSLLLVSVADIEAREHRHDAAIAHAHPARGGRDQPEIGSLWKLRLEERSSVSNNGLKKRAGLPACESWMATGAKH